MNLNVIQYEFANKTCVWLLAYVQILHRGAQKIDHHFFFVFHKCIPEIVTGKFWGRSRQHQFFIGSKMGWGACASQLHCIGSCKVCHHGRCAREKQSKLRFWSLQLKSRDFRSVHVFTEQCNHQIHLSDLPVLFMVRYVYRSNLLILFMIKKFNKTFLEFLPKKYCW